MKDLRFSKEWFDSLQKLNGAYRLEVYDAIFSLAFYEEKAKLDNISDMAFRLLLPSLEKEIKTRISRESSMRTNQALRWKKSSRKVKKFIAPTIDEVNSYILEKGYADVSAREFVEYYEKCGWKVGKNKDMVDWTAAVRHWHSRHDLRPHNSKSDWQSV